MSDSSVGFGSDERDFDHVRRGFDWREYFRENKLQVGLVAFGLLLLVVGVGVFFRGGASESSVEILSVDEATSDATEKIIVDVAGAVESPGVYELEPGARVGDALTLAGGFAENADRIWVHRFVNLAQKVSDGIKIYIPTEGEADNVTQNSRLKTQNYLSGGEVGGATIGLGSEIVGATNINTATMGELDALWGIGEKRAEAIIGNRPYSSVEELMTKAGIPKNVFERIKDKVAAY